MPDRRFLLLFALYFCQGLPGGFLAVVLPVVLREQGMSLASIGLAQALSLPWILKIFWAPLVDRYGSARIGRRKSWLIPAQLGMVLTTVALAFTSPVNGLFFVVVGFLVLNTFAATQDIAVDGWAIDMLGKEDLGPANGAQVGGFKVGNLVGGGVLVGLLGVVGWSGDFLVMAGLVLATLVFVIWTPEPPGEQPPPGEGVMRPLWKALAAPGLLFWLFVFYAKFGETFGGSLIKPMLVDNGFSKATIGWVDGTLGAVATILGALLCGLWVRKRGFGFVLLRASILQGLALTTLGIYQMGGVELIPFAALGSIEAFAGGGVGVCIFAAVMGRSDRSVGASNFTAAQVVYMAGAFAAAPLGGLLGDATSYAPPLVLSGLMAVGLGILAPRFDRDRAAPGSATLRG